MFPWICGLDSNDALAFTSSEVMVCGRWTVVAALAAAVVSRAGSARAQSAETPSQSADTLAPTDATRPLEAQLRGVGGSLLGRELLRVETRRWEVEHTQAWTLLTWGAVNVVQGAGFLLPTGLSAPAQERERTMGYGSSTLAWGAVNLALAIPWVVRLGREQGRLQRFEAIDDRAVEREIERARDEARSGAAFFALNTGLDVAYLTAGSLMLYMGERAETRNATLSGVGISVLVQGAALLAYDAWGWGARNADSARLRAVSARE